MDIAIATLSRETGGVVRHVLDLADGLRARGHRVVVALDPDAAAVSQEAAQRGIPSVSLERSTRLRADVWHLHLSNTLDIDALPLMVRRRLRSGAIVLTEHLPRMYRTDPSLMTPEYQTRRPRPGAQLGKVMVKRLEFALAHRIVTPSSASATFIARRYGLGDRAVDVIVNGIDVGAKPPDRDAGHRSTGALRVMIVGTLAQRKGHDLLFDAAEISDRDWEIHCVGDGVLASELARRADRLARTVVFHGWRDDAPTAARDADIVCIPSRSEAFPYVALEAMSCGAPIVATRADGLVEQVLDGVTGRLVDVDDAPALARAIDELIDDAPLRAAMGRAARQRVEAEFRLATMVERFEALYGAVDASGPRGDPGRLRSDEHR